MAFGRGKIAHRTPLQRLNDRRRGIALVGLAAGAAVAAVFRRRKGGGEAEFGEPVTVVESPARLAPSPRAGSGPVAETEIPTAASESSAVGEQIASPEDPPATARADMPDEPSTAARAGTPEEPPAAARADMPDEPSAAVEAAAKEEPPAAAPRSGSIVEPATGELSAEEASILAVLAQSGRVDDDRTALAVATSLERETTEVAAVLRKLGAEGVVSGDLYTAAGEKIWAVTERGVRRLGAQS